jgi:hypothetical protein
MKNPPRFLMIFSALMIIVGFTLGVYAWRDFQKVAIVVEWSTASELSTVGFNIYRSESKDGPYQKINQELIPASTDPLGGGDYSYRDTTVTAGTTYFYQLEDVDSSGSNERYGPIQVVAQRSGVLELVLAGGLILVSTFSFYTSLPRKRKADVTELIPAPMIADAAVEGEIGEPGETDKERSEGASGAPGSMAKQDLG